MLSWALVATLPALVSMVVSSSSPSLASAPPPTTVDPSQASTGELSGSWSYASGDAGRKRVRKAIEKALESMDPLSRDIAQKRLEKQLDPVDAIALQLDSDRVTIHLGTLQINDAPLGQWVDWSYDGTDYRVRHDLTDNGDLTQVVRSDKTTVRRRFAVKQDKLTLNFSLKDERLPERVSFWLSYRH